MFDLKPLSREGIEFALQKAERYRLLNEPTEAESICLDILDVEPDNQAALVMLLLSLTDQFAHGNTGALHQAQQVLARLEGEYRKAYYAGIISERRGKAQLVQGQPGSGFNAYDCFREAMKWYEKAETLRPKGDDSAILRWNTCARMIMLRPHLKPAPDQRFEPFLE